jgi:ribose/xylose/arabinose/galactoside ABC-type transport system permease subunit
MMSGGLDMAVGYQMSICGVVCALMLNAGVPIALCVIVTIVLSVIFGLIGTFLEQMLKLPRIFVSIGLSTVYQGIAYVITNSKTISGLSDRFKVIGQGTIFHPNLTYAVIAMVIFGLIMSFIMDRTYFGRYVFALGGNESAARLAGINVLRVKYAIGAIAGLFCGIGAVVLTARVGAASASTGAGTEITVMTGVLVGGVSVRGGDGKIANCIAGVLIMGLLSNGMQLAGLNTYFQYIAKGAIMLFVMWIDAFQMKRRMVAANKRKEEKAA